MVEFIILAAGKGTRMKTDRPKALVEAKGKPLLGHVLDNIARFGKRPHVVVGHRGEEVIALYGDRVVPVWQREQKGTGHAVASAKEAFFASPDAASAKHIVVLFADQPLISADSVRRLIGARESSGAAFALATVAPEHHEGELAGFRNMGRIVRGEDGSIRAIVEYKDATEDIRAIREVNVSSYCFDPEWLWRHLELIGSNNASGEVYLTDLVAIARERGDKVVPVLLPTREGMGANTPEELSIVERFL